MQPEGVRETVDLYLDGEDGAVGLGAGKASMAFIINVTDPAVAHEMLEKLPLGEAHMMSFELIPLDPVTPRFFARHAAETLDGPSGLIMTRRGSELAGPAE